MFKRLGSAAARHPFVIVLTWLLLAALWFALAVVGVTGQGLFDRLHTGEPTVPGAESQVGSDILADNTDRGESITLMVSGLNLTDATTLADSQRALNAFRTNVEAVEGVDSITDPFLFPEGLADPAAAPFVSSAGDGFLVTVTMSPQLTDEQATHAHDQVVALLTELPTAIGPNADGIISSGPLIGDAIVGQLESDLQRGELIALPISLMVMVVVFGGFLAAGIPIIGAIASIAGGLGSLYGFSYLVDLDSSVVNVVTVMALGLSIDYGLLIVSRFREEIRLGMDAGTHRPHRRASHDPVLRQALERTMATAGRTVTFSGLTVAICIGGLMVMRPDILKAVGAAGVSVVAIAVATALSLVPGLLGIIGRRLTRPPLLARLPGLRRVFARLGDVAPEQGFFSRLSGSMQRRPWLVVALVMGLLALMATPLLSVQLRNSGLELLPQSSQQRQFIDTLNDDYPTLASPALQVVVDGDAAAAEQIAAQVADLPNVIAVDPAVAVGTAYQAFGVRLDTDDNAGQIATGAVRDIRDLHDGADAQFWVVGQASSQVDFIDALAEGAPLAGGLVVLAIFVLLFLMTGSLLVPVKALIINSLSLAAGLGVTAWVFGQGHLQGLLNFESAGGLESYVVAMAAAFGFGLAMDYEVFLLARVKERFDAGEDNDTAVRNGLQRTGRIISSAALVMIIVFGGFMTGELLMIKQIGFALSITVLIDATLVRMLLVPATMTMLGRANWWAPAPLRWLHRRFAIHH